jgi:polyferredoxin
MDRVGYPRGLIRYDTQNGLAEKLNRSQLWRRVFRTRVLVYSSILLVVVAMLGVSLWRRDPFRVDVVRDRASLARIVDDGRIENVYRLQVMNATEQQQHYRLTVDGLAGAALDGTTGWELGPAQARWIAVGVRVPHGSAQVAGPGAHAIRFTVTRVGDAGLPEVRVVEHSTFVVPR